MPDGRRRGRPRCPKRGRRGRMRIGGRRCARGSRPNDASASWGELPPAGGAGRGDTTGGRRVVDGTTGRSLGPDVRLACRPRDQGMDAQRDRHQSATPVRPRPLPSGSAPRGVGDSGRSSGRSPPRGGRGRGASSDQTTSRRTRGPGSPVSGRLAWEPRSGRPRPRSPGPWRRPAGPAPGRRRGDGPPPGGAPGRRVEPPGGRPGRDPAVGVPLGGVGG
jgi:hypothetical protein